MSDVVDLAERRRAQQVPPEILMEERRRAARLEVVRRAERLLSEMAQAADVCDDKSMIRAARSIYTEMLRVLSCRAMQQAELE